MVDGGLASQVCKFAFGEWLSAKLDCAVMYDLSWFRTNGRDIRDDEARVFAFNEVFSTAKMIETDLETLRQLHRYCRFSNPWPHVVLEPSLIQCPRYYDGYYMNSEYFQEQEKRLRSLLKFDDQIKGSPRSLAWRERIASSPDPIAVHVRRGDFVGSIHDVTGPKYFRNAIAKAAGAGSTPGASRLFFFTTDPTYVTAEIIPLLDREQEFEIIAGNDMTGSEDMYLMSLCKKFVISNSGFSWVAAWLSGSEGRVVAMPQKWFAIDNEMTRGSDTAFSLPGSISIDS